MNSSPGSRRDDVIAYLRLTAVPDTETISIEPCSPITS